ncbi:MAG: hypothetical protein AAFP19_13455 [Bacteroidota bacterium]
MIYPKVFTILFSLTLTLTAYTQENYFTQARPTDFSDQAYQTFIHQLDSMGLVRMDSVSELSILKHHQTHINVPSYIVRYLHENAQYEVQEIWLSEKFELLFSHALGCYYDDCAKPLDYFLVNLDKDETPELVYWGECDETDCEYYTAYDLNLETNEKKELFQFIAVQVLHDAAAGYKVVEVPITENSFLERDEAGHLKVLDLDLGKWDTRKSKFLPICLQYGASPIIYKGPQIQLSTSPPKHK